MSPEQPSLLYGHEIHEVAHLVASSSLGTTSSTSTVGSATLSLHNDRLSLGSAHGTPAVKFAPLPQIDPNRKRSLAPLGVSARSRRKRVIQQEGRSLLWSTAPEEDMEDPLVAFAKFVKRASKTLWRRVRQSSKAVSQENLITSAEPVLDISPTVHPGDMAPGEKGQQVSEVEREDRRGRRASWSSSVERRKLSLDDAKRRNTSDLSLHSVVR